MSDQSIWAPEVTGTPGADGREIELQNVGGFVQWRYVGDASWVNLISVAELTGPAGFPGPAGVDGADGSDGVDGVNGSNGSDGREVELQTTATHIQWRYVGDVSWVNLVALTELGASGVQTVVAGTGIAVDNTDPANPVVSATGGGGGGGGGGMTLLGGTASALTFLSSSYALQVNDLIALGDVDIYGLMGQLGSGAVNGHTYQAVVLKVVDSTKTVLEVHLSDTYTISSHDQFSSGKAVHFKFATPVEIRREVDTANHWYIGIMRTDGSPTDASNVGATSSPPSVAWQFFRYVQRLEIADITPTVSEVLTPSAGTGHIIIYMFAGYPAA